MTKVPEFATPQIALRRPKNNDFKTRGRRLRLAASLYAFSEFTLGHGHM